MRGPSRRLRDNILYTILACIVGLSIMLISPEGWKSGVVASLRSSSCSASMVIVEGTLDTPCGKVEISRDLGDWIVKARADSIEISGTEYFPLKREKGLSIFKITPLRRTKAMGFILGFSLTLYVLSSRFSYVVTSILVLLLVNALSVLSPGSILSSMSSSVVFVILAGSSFELIMRKTGLDSILGRIVLSLKSEKTFLITLILVSSLLSSIMSNTAATYVMMPIVVSVVERGVEPFLLALVASTAVGGSLTLIGTPPNLIVSEFIRSFTGIDFGFSDWLLFGLPTWLFGIPLIFLLTILFRGKEKVVFSKRESRARFGRDQITALVIILITVGLWISAEKTGLNIGVIGLLSIALFTFMGLLDGSDITRLRWDLVLLLVGGLTLGKAMMNSGYAQWLIEKIPRPASDLGLYVLLLSILGIGTIFSSHTSASALIGPMMIPLGMEISSSFGYPPRDFGVVLAILATLSVNTAMSLPVSTPPSAIVFSSGKVRVGRMFTYGILFGATLIYLLVFIVKNTVWR